MTIISKIIKGFNTSENRETYKKIYNSCKYIGITFVAGILLYFIGNLITLLGQFFKNDPNWSVKTDESNFGVGLLVFLMLFVTCVLDFLHGMLYVYFGVSLHIETNTKYIDNKNIIILDTTELYGGLIEEGKGKKYLHEYIFYSDLYRIIFSYVVNVIIIFYELYYANWKLLLLLFTVGGILIDMCILIVTIICRVFYMVVIKSH